MVNAELKVYPDAKELSLAAAERIAACLQMMLQEKENPTLVLTGGRTPETVYRLLGSSPYVDLIDWKRLHILVGDERSVPADSPDSNFGMAWRHLLSKLKMPHNRLHRMRGELDAEQAALLYEQEIVKLFPGSGVPSFDLVLLGMGVDGHIASLFPETEWDEGRLVVANRVPSSGANRISPSRISMTLRLLNNAEEILFLVAGREKAEALADVLENPRCILPAARILPVKGNLTWMVDRAAASLLRKGV